MTLAVRPADLAPTLSALPRQRGSEAARFAGPISRGEARIAICNWRDLAHPEGGGSELYVEQVAKGLAALGNAVTLICAHVDGQPADEVKDGVTYRRRGGRFGVYLHAAASLATGRVKADVVVDVQNGLPWLSSFVVRQPVTVLVHHVHREQWPIAVGKTLGRVGWFTEKRVAPRIYRRASYLTVSQSTSNELQELGVAGQRINIAYNGTPTLAATTAQRSATPRVVVLGRLVPHKRVEVVIDALAQLQDQVPELVVDVVGQGWWDDKLREHAVSIGVSDRVNFHGFVDDATKADLLAQAWVNAVPSAKEGWALSVVEAATQSTPTIAFAGAGGLDESVVNGVTGILVNGDSNRFAVELGALLADEPRRHRLGEFARAHALGFTWESTVAKVAETLDACSRPGRH